MWIVTLIAHLACNTGYNTVLRHAAAGRKNDPLVLAAIMSTAIAAPAVVGIFVAGIDWRSLCDTRVMAAYVTTVAATLAFHIVNTKALEITQASVFSLLYNFRLAITTILGIAFLGEAVVPLRLAGGAFVFVAGMMLSGKGTVSAKGALLSIASAALVSIMNALEKFLIAEIGYAAYVFPSALIVAGALWATVLLGKRPVDMGFVLSRQSLGLMAFRCVSAYGFTLSLWLGALLSVSSYVSALNCVTTPIVAIIFLKETDSIGRKLAAGAVALAGVTLIFLAGR